MRTVEEDKELLVLLEKQHKDNSMKNPIYKTYREFMGRYAVLIGGSGSGKSYDIADKQIDRIKHEDDHRILCCRAELKQISESQVPLIVSRIKARYNIDNWKINLSRGNESITYLPNGNKFIFWGLDDPDKLRSIFDITSIWIEEADQTTDTALRELDRRLRGYTGKNKNGTDKYMQISFSFNPVSVLSWLKKRFFDEKEQHQIMLHGEQSFTDCKYWKSVKMPNLKEKVTIYDEDLSKDIEKYKYNTLVIHTTFLDNGFIDDTYASTLKQQQKDDPEEFKVYALGQWGVSGGTYFDKKEINRRILDNPQPIKQGYFEYVIGFDKETQYKTIKATFIDDEEGYIKIYKEPQPLHPYVLSGDTSGDGSDWNTGILTDNTSGIEVASVRVQMDEDLYALQMLSLGILYNNALIGLEMNFSSRPMKIISSDYGYSNTYLRQETPDTFTEKYVKKIGWVTTGTRTGGGTRPYILGMLRTLVREEVYKINSVETLYEMTTFVKNDKGKAEAMQGSNDDMIIAWAINLGIRNQQTTVADVVPYDINWRKVPEDYLEDYNNADEKWKQIILKGWREKGLYK